MFFRRGVSDDEWLEAKIWLFSIGAILALVGMVFANDWVIGLAALVLVAGMVLRFVPRKDGADAESNDSGDPPGSSIA